MYTNTANFIDIFFFKLLQEISFDSDARPHARPNISNWFEKTLFTTLYKLTSESFSVHPQSKDFFFFLLQNKHKYQINLGSQDFETWIMPE